MRICREFTKQADGMFPLLPRIELWLESIYKFRNVNNDLKILRLLLIIMPLATVAHLKRLENSLYMSSAWKYERHNQLILALLKKMEVTRKYEYQNIAQIAIFRSLQMKI